MFNIFKKNKIPTFKEFLEKEHPRTYEVVTRQLSGKNFVTAEESLFAAIEYYVEMLKKRGVKFHSLADVNFLIEDEDNIDKG